MWGQGFVPVTTLIGSRIIPTRVGTSGKLDVYGNPREDHPHACGDKAHYPTHLLYILGSSPRVWGQVVIVYDNTVIDRIIPTRVGTSKSSVRVSEVTVDHPHACEDKHHINIYLGITIGSSPRVWGQEG